VKRQGDRKRKGAEARVISSAEFAARLIAPPAPSRRPREEPPLSPQEVEEWLAFFGQGEA